MGSSAHGRSTLTLLALPIGHFQNVPRNLDGRSSCLSVINFDGRQVRRAFLTVAALH